jgi:hypothetical protein
VRCEETSGSKQSRWRSSQDQSSQPPFVEPDSHDHFQPIFQHNHLCRASLADGEEQRKRDASFASSVMASTANVTWLYGHDVEAEFEQG